MSPQILLSFEWSIEERIAGQELETSRFPSEWPNEWLMIIFINHLDYQPVWGEPFHRSGALIYDYTTWVSRSIHSGPNLLPNSWRWAANAHPRVRRLEKKNEESLPTQLASPHPWNPHEKGVISLSSSSQVQSSCRQSFEPLQALFFCWSVYLKENSNID